MGNKIVTEAMRKATPQLPGAPRIKQGEARKAARSAACTRATRRTPASARSRAEAAGLRGWHAQGAPRGALFHDRAALDDLAAARP